MKNKKGLTTIIIISLIIAGVLIFSGLLGGVATASKIGQIISSIPKWLWILIIFILIIKLLPKKK